MTDSKSKPPAPPETRRRKVAAYIKTTMENVVKRIEEMRTKKVD